MAPTRRAPDLDARERLLRAGEQLARRRGLKALTVRAVAEQARANLGSFVYHFGTRDAFVDEVVERWYAPLMQGLQLAAGRDDDPMRALRQGLLQFVAWVVDNRAFLAQLLLDAAAGEGGAQRFVRSIDARHPAVLLALIGRAQAAGHLRRDEPAHQLLFLLSTLALPVLAFHLVGRPGMAPTPLVRTVAGFTVDPAAIAQRLDWALRGLAPD